MKRTILVVDDEPAITSMLKLVLEARGFAVSIAESAATARGALDADTFDVVLTDMKMETDLAGLEVVRAARSQSYSPAIVVLTAFPILATQWREAGAHAMLAKPSDTSEILRVIERLLAKGKDRSNS